MNWSTPISDRVSYDALFQGTVHRSEDYPQATGLQKHAGMWCLQKLGSWIT